MITHNGITYKVSEHAGGLYATWSESRRSFRKSLRTKDPEVAKVRIRQLVDGVIAAENPTVADVWAEKYADASDAMRVRARSVWNHLGPHFGKLDASGLTHADLDAYVQEATEDRATGTVRLELAMLCSALRHAEKRGRASCPAYDLPEASAPRTRHLTDAEADAMLTAARAIRERSGAETPSREEVWLNIALRTGARKQAILDLTWDRVDTQRRLINLLPKGERQTTKRRPTVKVSQALVDLLMSLPRNGDKVVPEGSGRIDAALAKVAEEAGVDGFHPHVTRHTAATRMVAAGVSLFEVSKHLGCTVKVIERTYAHHAPEHGEAAAAALG